MQGRAWWAHPLAPSAHIHKLKLGARTALFCERTQQLSELNETAALAWRVAEIGQSCACVAGQLRDRGACGQQSAIFADKMVGDWLRLGYLTLAGVCRAQPQSTMRVGVGSLSACIRFFGTSNNHAAEQLFGHLSDCVKEPSFQIDVVGFADEDMIFASGVAVGMAPRVQTAPRLKGLVTRRYCEIVDQGFLAHAAHISSGTKSVLLTGAPGAGKTTLTLGLCAAGFCYGGDDITHVGADGRVCGAPFAAAVKNGAWALLAPLFPELGELTTHLREDGQTVRYLTPQHRHESGPKRLAAIIVLERRAGKGAELTSIEPSEALCVLLESGYAERRSIEGPTLKALSADLSRARCARLFYEDMNDALARLLPVLRE